MSGHAHKLNKVILGMSLATQGMNLLADERYDANSDDLEVAFERYEARKFDEAATVLRPHAEKGNARAQLYLATLFRTGSGVKADEYEAAYWYERAARQGVAEAQFHLGIMYLEGEGVTENSGMALEWISRAAEQGFGDAVDALSYMLSHNEALDC
jgi:uncharacterized protein